MDYKCCFYSLLLYHSNVGPIKKDTPPPVSPQKISTQYRRILLDRYRELCGFQHSSITLRILFHPPWQKIFHCTRLEELFRRDTKTIKIDIITIISLYLYSSLLSSGSSMTSLTSISCHIGA